MGLSASLNCKSAAAQLLWEPELSECYQFAALIPLPEIPLQAFNAFSFESLQDPSPLPTCSRRKSLPLFKPKRHRSASFLALSQYTQLQTQPSGSGLISTWAAKHILQKPLQEWTLKSKNTSLQKSDSSQPLLLYGGQHKPGQVSQPSAFAALCKYRRKTSFGPQTSAKFQMRSLVLRGFLLRTSANLQPLPKPRFVPKGTNLPL